MSALTKVFVVLLVVCSMLLSAAVIVFVNKQDNFAQANSRLEAQLAREQSARQTAESDLSAARANIQNVQTALQGQIDVLRNELNNAQQRIAERDQQIAQLRSQIDALTLEGQRLAEALKASEASRQVVLNEQAELRKLTDELSRRRADLNAANSDLQNRLDQTTRELRNTLEELKAAQDQVARLDSIMKDRGIAVSSDAQVPPALNIRGVIRTTQSLDGIHYATISVGSADGVTRGMQFNIVDREQGEWLGTLTVDSVDEREASGRLNLKGPVLNQIVANRTEVRTQL